MNFAICHRGAKLFKTFSSTTNLRASSTALHSDTLTSNQIRSVFLDFFVKGKAHEFVRSSSVIPENDRTLLLVNSGMNQFKPIFLGNVEPGHSFEVLKRAANSQKCIRVGGKHNDLENVGRNLRHHTFFEMLGNWSFGDYYKQEACESAWQLLTKEFRLDPRRLVVTYFGGDERWNLPADDETKEIWLSLGVKNSQILSLGSKDNFWEMGAIGPCGPCTEIHYVIDPKEKYADASEMLSRSIEIWNLVFMQFEKLPDKSLKNLPKKHVDTGMGFERIVSILQTEQQNSNYDSDLFMPLFDQIRTEAKSAPYSGSLENPLDTSYRILADHARMFTVAIADGLKPGKQNANHKLRKIIRTANWQAINAFKLKSGSSLLNNLSSKVADILGDAFPELRERIDFVQFTVNEEVANFEKLLSLTERKFKDKAKELRTSGCEEISAQEAYEFFLRYGAPKELLVALSLKHNLAFNSTEFERIHQAEKTRSVEMGGRL